MEAPPLEIRPARIDEAAALTRLALRSKAHWGYDDAFMAACVAELTVEPAFIADHATWVGERHDHCLGFYALVERDTATVELEALFVEPAAIGTGTGRALLEHAYALARAAGYAEMRIESDPNAEPFYRALGAHPVGSVPSASIAGREIPLLRVALAGGGP